MTLLAPSDWTLPPQAPVEEGRFSVAPGQALAWWDSGGPGAAVVLCHPFTGNLRSWPFQQPALVRAGYRVIAYSRRGFAGSDPLDRDRAGTQGGDLAALLTHLGVARAHVVGAAAGAWAALDFALLAPDRCLSVTSVCSLIAMHEPDMAEALARIHPDWFAGLPVEAKELSADFRLRHPKGVAWWHSVFEANPRQAGPRVSQPLSAALSWTRLAGLSVPHLICAGAADLYMPPALARAIRDRLAGSTLEVFPDAAHAPFVETPEPFNARLLRFLSA